MTLSAFDYAYDFNLCIKFQAPYSWVTHLEIPQDAYELLYRLGQKTEHYDKVKVEYFAPYLLKEGMVQRVQHFSVPYDPTVKQDDKALAVHIVEKFRFRADRMSVRETLPDDSHRVIEKFGPGRNDKLRQHEHYRLSSSHPTEYVSTFYSDARFDGLEKRLFKDLEMMEHYVGRLDGLKSLKAVFVIGEKKFGPAESAKSSKVIARITGKFKVALFSCT